MSVSPSYKSDTAFRVRLVAHHARRELPAWSHEASAGHPIELFDLLLMHQGETAGCNLMLLRNYDLVGEEYWSSLATVPDVDRDGLEQWAVALWPLIRQLGYPLVRRT